MDNSELANLNQIELDGPLDQPERGVMARDRLTGAILVVPREIVRVLLRLKHRGGASPDSDPAPSKADRMRVASLLHAVQHLRSAGRVGRKTFNPLFIRVSLFSVAPFQRHLGGLARVLVGPVYLWLLGLLSVSAVWLGIQSDWAILGAFGSIFSQQALLTFGIAAPLLKIFHELGHVLAATRYGSRVAQAGLLFIALFPIPFVDCSDADISANRRQRVIISLAGLFTDIFIGLVFFIAWHFSTGDFLRALFGNLFVYLTLNSILFNANPLVKLDGYFALADWLRYRNLSQDAGQRFKRFQLWVGSGGHRGELPGKPAHVGTLLYAGLSLGYRIYIIGFIAYSLLPRYMGLGALLVTWGLVALFYAPMMQQSEKSGAGDLGEKLSLWRFRGGVLAFAIIVLSLVRVPISQNLPVAIDAEGHYSLTVPESVQLISRNEYGELEEGAGLARFRARALQEQVAERRAELDIARRTLEAERDVNPLRVSTARRRVEALQQQVGLLEERLEVEFFNAGQDGVFLPDRGLVPGAYLEAGSPVGLFFPKAGDSFFLGRFPERYVHAFRSGLQSAELRLDGQYLTLDVSRVILQERVSFDQESGQRLYVLQFSAPVSPADAFGQRGHVLLRFRSANLWSHLVFHLRGLLQNLQESRLSELERQLGSDP